MKKQSLYTTAQVNTTELSGMHQGDFVAIVTWHEYNNTYTIRGIDGTLQCMVPEAYLTRFVL